MKNKFILYCFAIAFFCWLIPFLIGIFFIEIPELSIETIENEQYNGALKAVDKTIKLLQESNRKDAFIVIFKNNIQGCILNILGGVMLGLGTLVNLLINGFFFANMSVAAYESGLSFESILKVTLPHSFELIGFWLSGAMGYYIAWNIIQVMRGKEGFTGCFYKILGICLVLVLLIILSAAYVESYISNKYIN
jgi:uncharacterized membrane protein SpoIIM required for sporulation